MPRSNRNLHHLIRYARREAVGLGIVVSSEVTEPFTTEGAFCFARHVANCNTAKQLISPASSQLPRALGDLLPSLVKRVQTDS